MDQADLDKRRGAVKTARAHLQDINNFDGDALEAALRKCHQHLTDFLGTLGTTREAAPDRMHRSGRVRGGEAE